MPAFTMGSSCVGRSHLDDGTLARRVRCAKAEAGRERRGNRHAPPPVGNAECGDEGRLRSSATPSRKRSPGTLVRSPVRRAFAIVVLGLAVAGCTSHLPDERALAPEDPPAPSGSAPHLPDAATTDPSPTIGTEPSWVQIATTSVSTCVLAADGTAECWGNIPTTPDPVTLAGIFEDPRPLSDYDGIAELVTGESEICALDEQGRARCWGGGLPELPVLAELDMGREIKCARARGGGKGSIFCWPRWYPEQGATLPYFGEVAQIDAKFDHACARTERGHVHCWGRGSDGQLLEMNSTNPIAVPLRVPGLDHVVEVSTGGDHSCARRRDGTLWCWGDNAYGQLGDGTTTASATPRRVLGVDDAVQLALGAHHGCARVRDGAVWCWGWNHWQQLGDGTQTDRPTPIRVDLPPAREVSTYGAHTCVLLESGAIRCWGERDHAQLGPYGDDARGAGRPPAAAPRPVADDR